MDISSEKVREARMARGWTQQQLAEIANLSLRTVQRVETQSVASNETVSALSAASSSSSGRIWCIRAFGMARSRMRLMASWTAPSKP